MLWLLLGCSRLVPAVGLPFAEAEPAALVEGAVAVGGGEGLAATAHAQGESLVVPWRVRTEALLETWEEARWRYVLVGSRLWGPEQRWTWQSPEGETRGAVRLASGETLDLLVEDEAKGGFHWTAVDRVERRVVASGRGEGDRTGDVFAQGDTFLISTRRGVERFDPRAGAWTLLVPEPDACLRADTGAHLWWVAGGALRRGTLDGDEVRDVRDVPWVDPDAPLAPDQRVRVVADEGGWSVVYAIVRAPDAPARQGLHRQRYDTALRPLGGPIQLAGDVARGKDDDGVARGRWDVLVHDGVPIVARAPDGPPPPGAAGAWAVAMPRAPGWVRVDHATASGLALTDGPDGPSLWGETAAGGARQVWRVPIQGIAAAARPDVEARVAVMGAVRSVLSLPTITPGAAEGGPVAGSAVFAEARVDGYAADASGRTRTATVTLRMAERRCVARADVEAAFGAGAMKVRLGAGGTRAVDRVVSHTLPGEAPAEARQLTWIFDPGDDCLRRVEVRHRVPVEGG